MSLPNFSAQSTLFSTVGLSKQLFGPEDPYRLFALLVYPQLAQARRQLEPCYCADNGRSAVEPVLLLGTCYLQFLEGVPDRKAVELLRYHAGWNFALNRQLGDEVFHHTTLGNFRQRLLDKQISQKTFQTVLDALVEAQLVPRQGRQRLDSTQMLGCLSRMSRLDCVRESLRLALKEVADNASTRPAWWPQAWERYVTTQVDYRAGTETLNAKLVEAGTDAQLLLTWLDEQSQVASGQGPQVKVLRQVFAEHYDVVPADTSPTLKDKTQLSSQRIQNPHDPQATYAVKGQGQNKKEHVGYKIQVAETVQNDAPVAPGEPTPNFITGIVTHPAHQSDEAGALQMEQEQAAMGLDKPTIQYVDGAYVSAEQLAQVRAQGRKLMGPAQPAPANTSGRFTTEDFDIDPQIPRAICPAGNLHTQSSRLEGTTTDKAHYRFGWSHQCASCCLRSRCVAPDSPQRTVLVTEHHAVLQQRRREQKTPEFAQEMKHRPGIEGTQSELVRAHGLRRARYRGLEKVRLQNYLSAAACNIKRWLRRQTWQLRQISNVASTIVPVMS